jgi:hopanoid biosynthesis associated RND transporter like protein HpnN
MRKAVHSYSLVARMLRRLALCLCRHPSWFLYPQLTLAAVCILYAVFHLTLDMNRDDLIGPRVKSQQLYRAFEREFPAEGDGLVVVVESSRLERNREFIERLAARIEAQTNLFSDLLYKTELTTLGPKALLLAPAPDLLEMRRALEQYRPLLVQFSQATNFDSLFRLVDKQFLNASGGNASAGQTNFLQALPFLHSIISNGLQSMLRPGQPVPPSMTALFSGGAAALTNTYITLEQGRIFLLTTRPGNQARTSEAIERLRACIAATQTEVPGVDVGLTGGPVLDNDEMVQAERDTTRATALAFVLCAVLFVVAYGEVRRPLKAALCLLLGLAYAVGFTTLVIGHLNILSITFAPMLIGLAIDFAIHLISRFEEELGKHGRMARGLVRATAFTGQGIVTGALTTAGAFLAMALTHFEGIREMGIISGGGLLLCLVAMMTALPALLMRGRQTGRGRPTVQLPPRRLRIEFVILRRPVVVLVIALLLTLAAGLNIPAVYFDYDLLHMQSPRLPSVEYEKKLLRFAGASSLYGVVLAHSLDQARAYERALRSLPAVAEARSAADFMSADQAQKLGLIRSIKKELAGIRLARPDSAPVNLDRLSATLWYFAGYLGAGADAASRDAPNLARQLRSLQAAVAQFRVVMLRPEPDIGRRLSEYQRAFFAAWRRTLETLRDQDTSGPLRPQDLPPALRDRFVGVTGQYLVQVFPRKDVWQHANQREFLGQLGSVVPPDRITGTPSQLYEYTTLLKNSYEWAALYAFAAIVVMIFLHFRSVSWVLLALLPVAVGSVWLLGFMGITGVPFNPANIMTLPLVLGIGVTNGVQILNRYAEQREPSFFGKSTGKAVLVSGLTAIIGFGSLLVAAHQGIRSLGIVMSVGIAACMVAALTILPAVLRLANRRGVSEGSRVTVAFSTRGKAH